MKFSIAIVGLLAASAASAQVSADYAAMTPDQRWSDFVSSSVASPSVALRVFSSAAISHFNREPLSWGEGSRGYFERAGSHYARFVTQGAIHSSLAAALGHDTRYVREPGQPSWHRVRHALRRTFVTRNREGQSVFDVSEFAALYTAPLIASTWHPSRYGQMHQALHAGTFGIGAQSVSNLAKEFGPDLKRLLHK